MGSSAKRTKFVKECGNKHTHLLLGKKEVAEEKSKNEPTQKTFHSVISKIAFSCFPILSSLTLRQCRKTRKKCLRIFLDIISQHNCVCSSRIEEGNSFEPTYFNFNLETNILWCVRCDCVVIKLKFFFPSHYIIISVELFEILLISRHNQCGMLECRDLYR